MRLSVHIGVNEVDSALYGDSLVSLKGAHNDALAMRDLSSASGYFGQVLLGREANRELVLETIREATNALDADGELWITFAGHGVSVRGLGDDPDQFDEAWCLHDGLLLDDEIYDLLSTLSSEASVLLVSDCCFSGGLLDSINTPRSGMAAQAPLPSDLRTAIRSISSEERAAIRRLSPASAPAPLVAAQLSTGLENLADVTTLTARTTHTRVADRQVEALARTGSLPPGPLQSRIRARLTAAVTSVMASLETQLAFEGDRHGLFTAALISALALVEEREYTLEDLAATMSVAMRVQDSVVVRSEEALLQSSGATISSEVPEGAISAAHERLPPLKDHGLVPLKDSASSRFGSQSSRRPSADVETARRHLRELLRRPPAWYTLGSRPAIDSLVPLR